MEGEKLLERPLSFLQVIRDFGELPERSFQIEP